MSATWVMMIVIWVLVELIEVIRKKNLRSRLKSAAIWSSVITSLSIVGQMSTDQDALVQLAVSLVLTGSVAVVVYFIRVKIQALLSRDKTKLAEKS